MQKIIKQKNNLLPFFYFFLFIESFAFKAEALKVIYRDDVRQFFGFPLNVKVDTEHFNFYVIDSPKAKIIFYNFNFVPFFSLGKGRGIINPIAMDIDENGYIYVYQSGFYEKPPRISILNPLGLIEKEIPLNKEPLNLWVTSLAVDKKYLYLVGDNFSGAIILNKKTGKIVKRIKILDEVVSTLKEVTLRDVYIDRKGRIYFLSEEAGRFYVYDSRLKFLFKGGEKGGSFGKLSRPKAIAASPELGIIVVIDYMRHSGLVYDYKDGKFLGEFGGKGWLPGWFQGPMDVDIDKEGRIYVADSFNRRIQVLILKSGKIEGIWAPSFVTPLQPVK